jgi:HD-like signal output (HDOD) protein
VDTFNDKPDISLLRKFIPLNEWSNKKLEMLADALEIKHAKLGETLINRDSDDSLSYYLVRGKIQLTSPDGKKRELDAESPHAAAPLSQLMPHKCRVKCLSQIEYFCIDSALLNLSTSNNTILDISEGYEVKEGIAIDKNSNNKDNIISNQLIVQLQKDLQQDRLNIPSLPEIATRVGKSIERKSCNAETIARIIQTDPAITAKIVKAANSSFYGGSAPVDTCSQAIIRLGMSVTHSLVVNYTLRDLFQTKSKAINLRMHQLWIHSIKVAAICYVLAKRYPNLNPDEAMAIGLLHDIGVAAILNQAAKYPELAADPKEIDSAVIELRAPFSSLILKDWRFPEAYVTAAEEADNWMREGEGAPDYCDILILSQLHSYVGTKQALLVPSFDKIPAIPRLDLGPRQSLKVLKGLNKEIEQVRTLLRP